MLYELFVSNNKYTHLILNAATVWHDLPDDGHSAPCWFQGKLKSTCLVSPGYQPGFVYGIMIIELVSGAASLILPSFYFGPS